MNEIMTVENVRGYLDEQGTAHLNLEDCARGLGFVDYQEKVSATGGRKTYEVIRWARVNSYLAEFGFSQKVGKDSYIPENIFYRLAMKANNETAKIFQGTVADKILPSIRKTGMYMTAQAAENILLNPDFIIKLAEQVKAAHKERDEYKALAAAKDETINQLKPKADYCEKILQSPETLCVTVIAKDYGMSGVMFNEMLRSHKIQRKVGKTWVLYQEYVGKGYVVTESVVTKNGGSATQMKWTQKGRMFLYDFLKVRGLIPLCEREASMPDLFGGIAL